ncbi:MAG: hypothetical protein OWU84_01015 [Firmicutes bacterium]|nr:hypothetical protein [Bacillota bacterium]
MARWREYKCFDCDQIFLLPENSRASTCPRCGSDRIQDGGTRDLTDQ